ncbi:phosphoribosylanthranilate isomerase [Streptococcus rupicaprae]|uniref:N-(5'-phosphoribosyl)anthranilate isomerase n=1 Tax=Streptococcus rupicaprae TaxID=759619 RepID=A0ABV2FFF2_9STRE
MTRVKICGLSDECAIRTACEAEADYIGFVFATSKRQVSIEQAKALRSAVTAGVQVVGVFLNQSEAFIEQAIEEVGLDLVQIHGEWEEETVLSRPLIRARQTKDQPEALSLPVGASYLLLDAPVAGSGQTFEWQSVDVAEVRDSLFVAGGLTVDNVQRAVQHFQPFAVDVSSGVETNGQKDLEKIREFIRRVKG